MSLKIGITGGIGSGKTAVSELFYKKGFKVFYADNIAKEILAENAEVREKICDAFGQESYVNNLPDRKFLAKIVFNNPENLNKINSIIHPPTIEKLNILCQKELETSKLVFVESAIIYEIELVDIFDYILLVTADENIRIDRIIKRDNSKRDDVLERIQNQIPEEDKIERADFVIRNEGSLSELENKVDLFLSIFSALSN